MGARLKVNFIDVPSSWSSQEIERDERLPKFGTHTYRVLITGLKANYAYGIFSKRTPQYAARIFANGNFLIEYGKFADGKAAFPGPYNQSSSYANQRIKNACEG